MALIKRETSERRRLQSELLMKALGEYYNRSPRAFAILRDVIYGEGPTSLRHIDWFVTNYCRDAPESSQDAALYRDYRKQLKAYTKSLFDPFRRRAHVTLEVDGIEVETTIAQLNFFKWFTSQGGDLMGRTRQAAAARSGKIPGPESPRSPPEPRPVKIFLRRSSAIEFL